MGLFCKHVYGRVKVEYIGLAKIETGSIVLGNFAYETVKKYALISKCLKCDKKRVETIYSRN